MDWNLHVRQNFKIFQKVAVSCKWPNAKILRKTRFTVTYNFDFTKWCLGNIPPSNIPNRLLCTYFRKEL